MNHDKRTRKSNFLESKQKNLYYGKYFWILFKQVYCISSNEAVMSLDEKPEFILWLAFSKHKQDEFDPWCLWFGSAVLKEISQVLFWVFKNQTSHSHLHVEILRIKPWCETRVHIGPNKHDVYITWR